MKILFGVKPREDKELGKWSEQKSRNQTLTEVIKELISDFSEAMFDNNTYNSECNISPANITKDEDYTNCERQ